MLDMKLFSTSRTFRLSKGSMYFFSFSWWRGKRKTVMSVHTKKEKLYELLCFWYVQHLSGNQPTAMGKKKVNAREREVGKAERERR